MAVSDLHKEAIKQPKKTETIAQAVDHETRLRFHSEALLKDNTIARAINNFRAWVESILPKDKYEVFLNLFTLPGANVELSKQIYNELARVFDGKNPVRSYSFEDSDLADDWDDYQKELGLSSVWRTKGWETMKTAINSVLIVDLPEEQTGELPEPYFYFLGIEHVVDYQTDEKGKIDWIIFKQSEDRNTGLVTLAIFDQEAYRIVVINKKKEIVEEVSEVMHGLGYCPASFMWTDAISQRNLDLKEAPLTSQLSNLDWLLFFSTSKKHLDLYAPYPIYSAYRQDCDYENAENGDYCDGSYLRNAAGEYHQLANSSLVSCPKCGNKQLKGPGSFIEVPIPEKDGVDMRDPVTITTIDKSSLDYNVEEEKRLARSVYESVVGVGGLSESREALNVDHIKSNYDAKTSVLNGLKLNFEIAETFVSDTICRLRYENNYVGTFINYGTEFYILSLDDLYDFYKKAKENGSSEVELDTIQEQIIATKYRNNPMMMRRMTVLKHLEPYQHFTRKELQELNSAGLIDKDLLAVKINFNSFIDKFERDNINIVKFGAQLSFEKKIEIITKQLIEYGKATNAPGPKGPEEN